MRIVRTKRAHNCSCYRFSENSNVDLPLIEQATKFTPVLRTIGRIHIISKGLVLLRLLIGISFQSLTTSAHTPHL